MTDPKITQQIQAEIQRQQAESRFQLTPTVRHIHNGTDAPFAYQPTLSYTGLIQLDGTALALPTGWSVTYEGTGQYNINHNLNTTFYVCMVSPILSVTLPIASVTPGDTVVTVAWTDTLTGTVSDTTFSFLLVDATNRNTTPVSLQIAGF